MSISVIFAVKCKEETSSVINNSKKKKNPYEYSPAQGMKQLQKRE